MSLSVAAWVKGVDWSACVFIGDTLLLFYAFLGAYYLQAGCIEFGRYPERVFNDLPRRRCGMLCNRDEIGGIDLLGEGC